MKASRVLRHAVQAWPMKADRSGQGAICGRQYLILPGNSVRVDRRIGGSSVIEVIDPDGFSVGHHITYHQLLLGRVV